MTFVMKLRLWYAFEIKLYKYYDVELVMLITANKTNKSLKTHDRKSGRKIRPNNYSVARLAVATTLKMSGKP